MNDQVHNNIAGQKGGLNTPPIDEVVQPEDVKASLCEAPCNGRAIEGEKTP